MLPRQIARELALLSLSQLPTTPEKLETQQLQDLMLAAVRTLRTEASEALETAAAELQRSSDRLLDSETIANSVPSARAMLKESIELAQLAINRVGSAMEIPELVYLSSNQQEVYEYALELTKLVHANRTEVDNILKQSLVNWQLDRIARIDRDILRIAVVEMLYVGIDEKVAINQAIELAKRYSGNEEYRFINGVLRRVSNLLKSNLV
ncbi:transcription antitermination protein NusB [Desertifilum sp. FACHB-1129]|uniref:Transcription antitermination protein NusB n=2 Tax=Cyanophyceae TaxID=3028117 RepID=A0A1E5QDP6_9CYAN|nr:MULTISPECIES: transcription antitermination factor NusB [Cyanophyceae]MCD8486086.1 transcription antitermination factor NusB [Desertifilum sp.]MDA0208988.1 transcription antitermination factor NusB [Cyanobacteria bacterium FC1]MDK3158107.1 transcription antitermination factor NusB [Kamptonema cortianum]MBD2310470.1 transcription antitermination protein NusB [Desertifilum sp. FACHB-1129]MBD2321922.1 transcription antitermination protein NusB [Desertifilum sp. FACHB-866]